MVVVWLPSAIDDLEAIVTYIYQYNPNAAIHLEDLIFEAAQSLSDHPYKGVNGRVWGTRELLVHPNYWLIYDVSDVVHIRAIFHTRRNYP